MFGPSAQYFERADVALKFAISDVSMTGPIREPTSQVLIGDTDATACSKCKEAGTECVRSVNVRFRNGLDLVEDQSIAFPESKSWPRLMGSSTLLVVKTCLYWLNGL